jgi:hypothetical protein
VKAGQRGEPFLICVEAGKVREFARAVRATARYGSDTPVSPPTFLMSAAHWAGAANAAWGTEPPSFERLLHGEQEFEFVGPPPRVGDRLIGQVRIDQIYTKHGRRGRMTFIETVTDFRRESTGELAATSRATLIEMGAPEEDGARP